MNRNTYLERLGAFRSSCHAYQYEKELLDKLQKDHPFLAEQLPEETDSFRIGLSESLGRGNLELLQFLRKDIRFVENTFQMIEQNYPDAREIIYEVYINHKGQEAAAQEYRLTRNQVQYISGKCLHEVLEASYPPIHKVIPYSADFISDFKKECRDYFFYIARIQELLAELDQTEYFRQDVRALPYFRIGQSPSRKEKDPLRLLERKDRLYAEFREQKDHVEHVIQVLQSIPYFSYSGLIWMLYVQNRSYSEVANLYSLNKGNLGRQIADQFRRAASENE